MCRRQRCLQTGLSFVSPFESKTSGPRVGGLSGPCVESWRRPHPEARKPLTPIPPPTVPLAPVAPLTLSFPRPMSSSLNLLLSRSLRPIYHTNTATYCYYCCYYYYKHNYYYYHHYYYFNYCY